MASVGLPAHAVASLLARLGPRRRQRARRSPWRLSGRRQWTRAPILRRDESIFRETNGREDRLRGTGFGSDRDRVARRTVHRPRVDVTTTAPRDARRRRRRVGSRVAVSHDCWIESLRDVVAETAAPTFAARAADAPRWALDERTRGADRLPFRTVFLRRRAHFSDREDSDEDSDPPRFVTVRDACAGVARRRRGVPPADAASARVLEPATVVATQLGVALWRDPRTGFRGVAPDTGPGPAPPPGRGEGGAGDDNAVTFADGAAFTALGFSPNPPARPPATTHPPPRLVVGVPAAAASRGDAATGVCARRARVARRRGHSREPRGRRAWIPSSRPSAGAHGSSLRSPRPARTTGPSVYGTFARDRGRRRRRSRATREGSRR